MKINKKLLQAFNDPSVILVVSAWPEKVNGKERNHGIAWYTKLITEPMAKIHKSKFVVLAEEGINNKPRVVGNGNILILRVFDHKHISLYPTILQYLRFFPNIRRVIVHSEFGVNAGLIHYALLIPFLILIRLTGKYVTYVAHNVITDVSFLSNHLHIPSQFFLVLLLNQLARLHTQILVMLSDAIITLDAAVYSRVISLVQSQKVQLFPIPVQAAHTQITSESAKKKIGLTQKDTVLLCFGFLSSYKGSDWIVEMFDQYINKHPKKRIHLIMAGGPADSHREKPYYQAFYKQLMEQAAKNSHIQITGYVKEQDIPTYFTAADLVVLPYRGLIGGSGALSLALSYKKPVVLSTGMKDMMLNTDVQESVTEANITKEMIFFPLTNAGIDKIIITAEDKKKRNRLKTFSTVLAIRRSVPVIVGNIYGTIKEENIYEPSPLSHKKPAVVYRSS